MEPVNHASQPAPDTKPKHPTGNNRGLGQAYDLRDMAANEAIRLNAMPLSSKETPSQRAASIANLIKAWDYASDRIRVMRNRPLPGSLRPESKPKATAQPTASPLSLPKRKASVAPALSTPAPITEPAQEPGPFKPLFLRPLPPVIEN